MEDVRSLLRAGADKVSINTAAVDRPELVSEAADRLGSANLIVAIDARRRAETGAGWEVFTHGGRTATGIDAVQWAVRMEKGGAGEILLTSMDRDGTRAGYDLELLGAVTSAVRIPVIASGGAGKLEHFAEALADDVGASAVLADSLFHFGELTISEARRYLADRGVPVRPVPS